MRVPDFDLEDVEDAYAYYVLILGVPEPTFWDAPIAFVRDVCRDKAAYDSWLASEHERISKV